MCVVMKLQGSKCKFCTWFLPRGMAQCLNPKCRAWNIAGQVGNLDDHTVLLTDAKLSVVERVKTGLVDKVFGGGIARTSVNLLGGEPGAGKTTLCLMLCNIFGQKFDRESLYIANEQDADEIRTTGERLELSHGHRIRIVKAMGGINFSIGELFSKYKPCLVILDSLTKWVGDDMELAVSLAYQLKEIAVKLGCPVIAINQVNKDGDHAGLKKLEHAVDWAGMFDILAGELDEEGKPLPKQLSPRRLESSKNRFGPAPEEEFYAMTERGLIPTKVQPL